MLWVKIETNALVHIDNCKEITFTTGWHWFRRAAAHTPQHFDWEKLCDVQFCKIAFCVCVCVLNPLGGDGVSKKTPTPKCSKTCISHIATAIDSLADAHTPACWGEQNTNTSERDKITSIAHGWHTDVYVVSPLPLTAPPRTAHHMIDESPSNTITTMLETIIRFVSILFLGCGG